MNTTQVKQKDYSGFAGSAYNNFIEVMVKDANELDSVARALGEYDEMMGLAIKTFFDELITIASATI